MGSGNPLSVGVGLKADMAKARRQADRLARLKVQELIQEQAGEALRPASEKFAEQARAEYADASPLTFREFAYGGNWRGGVRARVYKKSVRISVLAMAAHDLSTWNKGTIRAPFFGSRDRWHDISAPRFRGTGNRVGRSKAEGGVQELSQSVAQALTDRFNGGD